MQHALCALHHLSWGYAPTSSLPAQGDSGDQDLAIRSFRGAEGEYNFDANGDGLHGYNVVRNDGGTLAFIRHAEFQESS